MPLKHLQRFYVGHQTNDVSVEELTQAFEKLQQETLGANATGPVPYSKDLAPRFVLDSELPLAITNPREAGALFGTRLWAIVYNSLGDDFEVDEQTVRSWIPPLAQLIGAPGRKDPRSGAYQWFLSRTIGQSVRDELRAFVTNPYAQKALSSLIELGSVKELPSLAWGRGPYGSEDWSSLQSRVWARVYQQLEPAISLYGDAIAAAFPREMEKIQRDEKEVRARQGLDEETVLDPDQSLRRLMRYHTLRALRAAVERLDDHSLVTDLLALFPVIGRFRKYGAGALPSSLPPWLADPHKAEKEIVSTIGHIIAKTDIVVVLRDTGYEEWLWVELDDGVDNEGDL